MASTEPSRPAGCSPLRRAHRQQPTISSAASAHLRHLQQVASWASQLVPPLGAFLGSRLAATSEILGCPPPSSPNFTCQRCESILHVGINCSVRVRTRKLKKQCTVTKGVPAPINILTYLCQHCAFESVMSGTSKSYVKTKLSEAAACRELSKPHQSLDVCMTGKVTQPIKVSSNEILSSVTFSTESPGNTSKRTKRKGWLSLKRLSVSSTDLSPAGSRLAFSTRSAKLPLLPQSRRLDSTRVMPTVSQMDIKCLVPTSGIVEERCIKTMLELKPSEGEIGSDKVVTGKVSDADSSTLVAVTGQMEHFNGTTTSPCLPQLARSDSLGVVATSLWSDAEVMIPISSSAGQSFCSEKPLADTTDLLQQSNASGITMNVEDKVLKQKLSTHHTEADAAMLGQFTALASVSKCSVQDTISTLEAQYNSSCADFRTNSAIVVPTASLQESRINDDATCNSNSVESVVDASLPLIVNSSMDCVDDKVSSFPLHDKDVIMNNSRIAKSVQPKKRKCDDGNKWCFVPRKQENSNSNSVESVVEASLPLIVRNSMDCVDDKAISFPLHDKEVIMNNSSIAKSVQPKKKKCDDGNKWCFVPRKQENSKPEADKLRLRKLDMKQTSMMMLGPSDSIHNKINTQTSAHERKVKPRTKKKPVFKRVGRQWFTICKLSRTLKWRII